MEEIIKNGDTTAKKQVGRPFQKGQSGNPAGRPKGSVSITTEIKRKLEETPKGQKKTYLELLVATILKRAIEDGNEQLIRQIWNYVDGMPKESRDITLETRPILQVSSVLADRYHLKADI